MQTPKKEVLYELIDIPESFGPVEVVLGEEKAKSFAFSVDDYCSWYLGSTSPFGGPICHPLILANELLWLYFERYDRNTARGLHTQERLNFLSPIRRGESVTIAGAFVERYERRGQGYVALEAVARGDDGRELMRHRGVEIVRADAGAIVGRRSVKSPTDRKVTTEVLSGATPVRHARRGLAHRTPLVSLSKHVTQEQMYVFSWGGRDFKNVHTDLSHALDSGLTLPVVQAQHQVAFVTEAMVLFFGPSWFTSGKLDMKFISPAYAGDTLVVEGAVLSEVEIDGEEGLEVEVWIRCTDGTLTGIGWARASLETNATDEFVTPARK